MMRRFGVLFFLWAGTPALCVTTYTHDVQPILSKHCVECHDSLGHDPDLSVFPFVSIKFSSQRVVVDRMLERVRAQEMPPGIRPKLNQQQISTIQQWQDDGLAP